MSAATEATARPRAFSPGAVLALVIVGIVAFAGLAVLSAYAPDLRHGQDGRAHAMSRAAVGYAGAPILLKGLDIPVLVSRSRPSTLPTSVVILTPDPGLSPRELQNYPKGVLTLIVLPKWIALQDLRRPGYVTKGGLIENDEWVAGLLESYALKTRLAAGRGVTQPVLHGVGGAFAAGDLRLQLGRIDRLRTISGEGWVPLLADEQGRAVLVQSGKTPSIWVLAEPDLLNNQGLRQKANARAAALILQVARGGDRPILFDVTLNGLARPRGLGRLMLEPPFLAATLCGVAAAVLMGVHALARFGQPRRIDRAIALGAQALVDNSADLVKMARKEHELAPAYAALTNGLIGRAAGAHVDADFLEHLAERRGAASPAALAEEAAAAKSRDDLLAVARKLYQWRGEMTRERR